MLVCMVIMVLLLSLGAAASREWGRQTRMRGAMHELKSGLDTARQWAMTHQTRTEFSMTNHSDRAWYSISDIRHDALIGATNALASGIVWTNAPPLAVIRFKPDGTPDRADDIDIVITEDGRRRDPLVSTVRVYRVTGHAEIQRKRAVED